MKGKPSKFFTSRKFCFLCVITEKFYRNSYHTAQNEFHLYFRKIEFIFYCTWARVITWTANVMILKQRLIKLEVRRFIEKIRKMKGL